MVALDWKKATDSIHVGAMLNAIRAFGVPESMMHMIGQIYENRHFSVADGRITSQSRPQESGISQGCPLSPFLFVMVMSVVIRETRNKLPADAREALDEGQISIL
eukprot:7175975-Pyramimonas_sp.AAC.1